MTQQVVHGFIPKMKQSIFMLILRILILLSAAAANGSLKNSVTLKYLNNFWKSLECHLATGGNENDINFNNFIFTTIKDTILYVPIVTL